MTPFTPMPVDPVAAAEIKIITTATDIGGQICDDIKRQEDQKSESEISFQIGAFTIGTGGGNDDDDDEEDEKK